MFKSNFNLNGKFKFDVFDKFDNLKSTTNYLPNFITSTGLTYPFSYAFADCFRYLSVGTGTGYNFITGDGTTGLSNPILISGYSYVGGGGGNCENGSVVRSSRYHSNGCGYRINNSGITLLRAWRIPEDTNLFFTGDTILREYMLSPGRPYVTGFTGESFLAGKVCGCSDSIYPIYGNSSIVTYGNEPYQLHNYYKDVRPLCDSTSAFTRILKNIDIQTDEYLIVNYALDINFETGIKSFNLSISRSNQAIGDPLNWSGNVSGIYSIVHPGLKLIYDNSFITSRYVKDVWGAGGTPLSGESFVPPLGDVFEPYLHKSQRSAYISNDNLQFLVNDLSGAGMNTGSYFPYNSLGRNFPSGLLAFHKNWITETTTNSQYLGDKLFADSPSSLPQFINIRKEGKGTNGAFVAVYPSQSDYRNSTTISNIDEGKFDLSYLSSLKNEDSITENSYIASDRQRSITLGYQWKDPSLVLTEDHFAVRACVISYDYDENGVHYWYPFLDCLFSPKSGKSTPLINTGSFTYASPTGILNNDGGYFYIDGDNSLQLQFKISWSSPCSSDVTGCI